MIIRTLNSIYTLTDCGDGGFLIHGTGRYLNEPTMCRLLHEPMIGEPLRIQPLSKEWAENHKPHLITSIVQTIEGQDEDCGMPTTRRDLHAD